MAIAASNPATSSPPAGTGRFRDAGNRRRAAEIEIAAVPSGMHRLREQLPEVRLQAPSIPAGQQHDGWSGCGSHRGAKSPASNPTTRNARRFTAK